MDIELQRVGFSYAAGTPFEKRALYDVDFAIESGIYQAIIGHTGSGANRSEERREGKSVQDV